MELGHGGGGSRLDALGAPPRSSLDAHPRPTAEPVGPTKTEPAPLVDPALANCANPIVAEGTNSLIDDFEDANARIAPLEGRAGSWRIFNDRTGKQVPEHASVWHPALIPGGRGSSRYALHTWGGVFESWGVTGGFALAAPRCYDASVYGGVKFWAKGPGRVMFSAKMTQVIPVEDGGTCREKCYDVHRTAIDLTKRWAEYTIAWRDLAQQGLGPAVAFDAKSLFEMAFFVDGEDTPFNFWIDDLSFVPRASRSGAVSAIDPLNMSWGWFLQMVLSLSNGWRRHRSLGASLWSLVVFASACKES